MLGAGWVVWLRWLSHAHRRATSLSGRRSAASGSGLQAVPLHIFACAAAPAAHHRACCGSLVTTNKCLERLPGIEGLQCSNSLGIHRTTNAQYFYQVQGRSEQSARVSGCSVLGVGWVVWLRWLSHAHRRATGLLGQRSTASGSGLKVIPLHIFARAAVPVAHHQLEKHPIIQDAPTEFNTLQRMLYNSRHKYASVTYTMLFEWYYQYLSNKCG